MAPEQMRASPDIDARADIWSLGAILFELLTGQCPFEGETLAEVCGKVLSEAPPSLSAFSAAAAELDPVIARCLQKDPNLRYQSVTEFAAALRAWRPSEDVEIPEPDLRRNWRRSARLPATVGLCAAVALGAVGLWHSRGSAASLESKGVRPMIAAAAAPIWRSLPEPSKAEPERAVLSPRPERENTTKPSVFQTAAFKNAPPVAAPEAHSLPLNQTVATTIAALPNTVPSMAEATASASSDPPVTAVDPVSGRYGL
jgi:serine/threonine protein kinase